MTKSKLAGTTLTVAVAALTSFFLLSRLVRPKTVKAISGGGFNPAVALEDNTGGSTGGMAQYAVAEEDSASQTASVQAVSNWNGYLDGRTGWDFSSSDVTTIGDADWNARQAGSPTITSQQIAGAVTQIINSTLATMSASQQQGMFDEYTSVSTPLAGTFVPNWADPYVSVTQNTNGAFSVSVSANQFSSLKSFFQQYAPGMMSSGPDFYPGEAMIVVYTAATCDRGYGSNFTSEMGNLYSEATGLAHGSYAFGDTGYVCKRPLNDFLSESNVSQLFSDLGF
jgi:hypothetical protein